MAVPVKFDPALSRSSLYGTQTELALGNFRAPGRTFGEVTPFVRGYVQVKLATARANHGLGVLDQVRLDAIAAACEEILAGGHADQFPSALVLGGGGTTTNMNGSSPI